MSQIVAATPGRPAPRQRLLTRYVRYVSTRQRLLSQPASPCGHRGRPTRVPPRGGPWTDVEARTPSPRRPDPVRRCRDVGAVPASRRQESADDHVVPVRHDKLVSVVGDRAVQSITRTNHEPYSHLAAERHQRRDSGRGLPPVADLLAVGCRARRRSCDSRSDERDATAHGRDQGRGVCYRRRVAGNPCHMPAEEPARLSSSPRRSSCTRPRKLRGPVD